MTACEPKLPHSISFRRFPLPYIRLDPPRSTFIPSCQVIAYEPPAPGEESCEICHSVSATWHMSPLDCNPRPQGHRPCLTFSLHSSVAAATAAL